MVSHYTHVAKEAVLILYILATRPFYPFVDFKLANCADKTLMWTPYT